MGDSNPKYFNRATHNFVMYLAVLVRKQMFEDTKWVIRSRRSKNRQCNGYAGKQRSIKHCEEN